MSEALKKLEDLGVEKIYEDTHIPVEHIRAILHKDYSGLTRIQYQGFISILEREYGIDLSDLKADALEFFSHNTTIEPIADDTIFTAGNKHKNLKILYIILILILFAVAFFYLGNTQKKSDLGEYNQTLQENIAQNPIKEENLSSLASDVNQSNKELNATVAKTQQTQVNKPETMVFDPIEIVPHSKVWLGYINVETHKKHQKTFADEFDLDGNSEWIMLFGHGYVSIIVNGKEHKFSEKNRLRLHYKNGHLEQIGVDEFKELNRGSQW